MTKIIQINVWFLDDEVLKLRDWVANPMGLRQKSAQQMKTRSASRHIMD